MPGRGGQHRAAVGVGLGLLLLGAQHARAQEAGAQECTGCPEREAPTEDVRTLAGHTFLFPQLQDSAFVATYFGTRMGLGALGVQAVPLGSLGPRAFTLLGLQQAFDLGVRFTDWLGVSLVGRGRVIVAANTTALVLRTGQLEAQLRLSPVVRLWRGEGGTQVSARLSGGVGTLRRLTVAPLVESLVDRPVRTVAGVLESGLGEVLLVPGSERALGGSVHVAQALGPSFGLQGAALVDGTWRTERPFDPVARARVARQWRTLQVGASAALTMNLARLGVPVGALVEYLLAWSSEQGDARVEQDGLEQTAGAGLYYTGRHALQLGLVATVGVAGRRLTGTDAEGAPAQSQPQRLGALQLELRYVW